MFVGLTELSPLVRLRFRAFTVRQTTLKVVSCQVVKLEKTCSNNQHVFIPFAFDTLSFLASETVDLLQSSKGHTNNVMSHRSMIVVFTMIGFAIKKRLSRSTYCLLAFYSYVINH